MSALGDPLVDLGLLLAYWSATAPPGQRDALTTVTNQPGYFTRDEIVERYAAGSGRDLSTDVEVDVHDQSGAALSKQPAWPAVLNTDVYESQEAGADQAISSIVAANLGHPDGADGQALAQQDTHHGKRGHQ